MAEKTVKITFEVDGISQTVNSVDDLNAALGKTKKATKEASDEGSALGMLKGKFAGITGPLKGVVAGMKTLKGAIISTGIGALVVALGSLVAYFQSSEEGSKKLAIATETLGILWGKLVDLAAGLGESLMAVFSDPVQAVKDLGQAIVDNVIERFNSLMEVIGFVGSAFKNLFMGEFQAALDDVKSAGTEMVDVFTGVDNSVEKIAETGKKVFNEIKTAVEEATVAATKLVNTTRAIRDQQQALVVENANLNKELETQQKIAEDTTLTYDERKAALERVGEAQVKLAENIATQTRLEESLLQQRIAQEGNYEKREELETQLAEATAGRIEAETALELKKQDAQKITRELELEELDRKKTIRDLLQENQATIEEDAFNQMRNELDLQQMKALEELENLKASEAEKLALKKSFSDKKKQVDKEEVEFKKMLDQQAKDATLATASSVFGTLSQIAGEGSAAAKAFSIAQTTIDTYQSANAAYKSVVGIPVVGPTLAPIAAGVAVAGGLLSVKKILSTKLPGNAGGSGGGGGGSISVPQVPAFDPNAALDAAAQQTELDNTVGPNDGQPVIKAFVVASDMTNQQEADRKIDELASL
jgi:hypothetical protein